MEFTRNIPRRYVMVLLMFISTCICYVERVGFPIAYTMIAKAGNVDPVTKGWVLSAFYYGYASSQIPGGWAAAHFGGHRILLWSFLLWSVIAISTPARSVPVIWVILIRVLIGVAQGFIFPAIHTVLAQWIPTHERSRGVSLTMSGMYLGAAAGMQYLPGLLATAGPGTVFNAIALMGFCWSILWWWYGGDPPGGDLSNSRYTAKRVSIPVSPRLSSPLGNLMIPDVGRQQAGGGVRRVASAFLEHLENSALPTISSKKTDGDIDDSKQKHKLVDRVPTTRIPWVRMLWSLPVWAIIVNNFSFHYVLYVLMNWLPTYFDQVLGVSLASVGAAKMLPYFLMFIFNNLGGWAADYAITRYRLTLTGARKLINTVGFLAGAISLAGMPVFRTVGGAVICSSITLGACAFARGGFAVNHMDIAPRYAGVLMGISNTAGTAAGVVGVSATGFILEMASSSTRLMQMASKMDIGAGLGAGVLLGWSLAFWAPALLCLVSVATFCLFATGEKVFE